MPTNRLINTHKEGIERADSFLYTWLTFHCDPDELDRNGKIEVTNEMMDDLHERLAKEMAITATVMHVVQDEGLA